MDLLASSTDDYAANVTRNVYFSETAQRAVNVLGNHESWDPAQLRAPGSLSSWFNEQTCPAKVTVIVGETRGRPSRDDTFDSDQEILTSAATSDGVAACKAAVALIQGSRKSQTIFDGLVDEWLTETRQLASNLLIVGSGEVNLVALFLNGLVPDFHFGISAVPAVLSTMGDKLIVGGRRWLRSPGTQNADFGAAVLMRNPWSQDHQLLWLAGVTGRATHGACTLVASGWKEYEKEAGRSRGVVFLWHNDGHIEPKQWLIWNEGEPPFWEDILGNHSTTLSKSPPPPADKLITIREMSKISLVAPQTISKKRSLFPPPDVTSTGRRPARWFYRKVRSILEEIGKLSLPPDCPSCSTSHSNDK